MRILLIEDNDDDVLIMRELLAEAAGFEHTLHQAGTLARGLQRLAQDGMDVVLVDLSLPDSRGLDTFTGVYDYAPHLPIIVLTGYDDETLGLQAIQMGAQDYLVKGHMDSHLLRRAIRYAIERKRSEEILRQQRDWFDGTLVSIGDAVVATQTNNTIRFFNPAAERLTGWPPHEALGRRIDEVCQLLHEQTQQPLDHLLADVLRDGTTVSFTKQTALRTRDGRQIPIVGSSAPIRSHRKELHGAVLVLRDVSEQRRLEEELLRAQKIESVGVLAGGIAHDFNNLLTGIMGNISLAKRYAGSDERVIQRLIETEHACHRATALTHQLLTFAKGGTPVRRTTNIARLLHEEVAFALSGGKVRADFRLAANLWPGAVDDGQIAQVIHNVVRNAVHAMPDGGTIQIFADNVTLTADSPLPLPPGRYLEIGIQDHGCGIPHDVLPNIFDPYFTTKAHGNGLGLATAYAIVTKHQGTITVQTEVGAGTTVLIYLPASQQGVEPVHEPVERPMVKGGRMLVMDDEAYIRDLLNDALTSLGYTVESAQDGVEAITLYQRAVASGQPFAAVILDITIPGGMGGLETIEHIRAIDPQVKAILSSGYANAPVMSNFAQYGFQAVLTKPYDMQGLNDVLQRVLGHA